jgi:hypothetical protein
LKFAGADVTVLQGRLSRRRMMMRWQRLLVAMASTLAGFGTASAGPFDPPKPFVRAEDQERARLLGTPCAEADIGHGCYRHGTALLREAPCTYRIDANTIGSLPTDQCVKMEEPRRYRGVWIDAFEGQQFIADGTTAPQYPRGDPRSPGWREQADRAWAASIWLDVARVEPQIGARYRGRKMRIDFVGRKTRYLRPYGHLGMSGNEIIVDRLISLQPLE